MPREGNDELDGTRRMKSRDEEPKVPYARMTAIRRASKGFERYCAGGWPRALGCTEWVTPYLGGDGTRTG